MQREQLVNGLKIAGLIGNLIKYNATISGAQGGCQAEVGAACSMGAAMVAYLMGLSMEQIEYAAEMGIEHHLGLTCDPVGGYVMIHASNETLFVLCGPLMLPSCKTFTKST